jgi:hypothetical protein
MVITKLDDITAYALGIEDGLYVKNLARDCNVRSDDTEILLDCSDYSPSWRALPNGEQIWGTTEGMCKEYERALDATIKEYCMNDEWIEWFYGKLMLVGCEVEDPEC